MSDIFQEVDEEVRRDKAAEFWKKYQNQILAAARRPKPVSTRSRRKARAATGRSRR
jgi:hypothetical protein